ncbi:MAG: glycosyltransferase family 4 protein [Candidatus Helarchaeota archaeon]
MDILVIFPRSLTGFSGGEKRFIEILKLLKNKKVNFKIIQKKPFRGFPISLWGFGFIILSFFIGLKSKFNLIYSPHGQIWDTLPAYLISRVKKRPYIMIYHEVYYERKRKVITPNRILPYIRDLIFRKIGPYILTHSNGIIGINILGINEIKKLFNYKKPIELIGNGIDYKYIRQFENYNKEFDCSYLGRITEMKGAYDLIDIFDKNRNLTCILVGTVDKKMKSEYLKKLDELENIKVYEGLSDDEAYSMIAKSKIFIIPTKNEGWCISIAEAMALGLPVITYNLPVFKNIFENKINYVPINNIKKLLNKINELLNNDKLLDFYRKNGIEFIKRYNINEIANKELRFFMKVYQTYYEKL